MVPDLALNHTGDNSDSLFIVVNLGTEPASNLGCRVSLMFYEVRL